MNFSNKIFNLCQNAKENSLINQIEALIEMHGAFKDNGECIPSEDQEICNKFLGKLWKVQNTDLQPRLQKAIRDVFDEVQNMVCSQKQGERLAEIDYVIETILRRMNISGSYEDLLESSKSEEGFYYFYNIVRDGAGFRDDDDEPDLDSEQKFIYEKLMKLSGTPLYENLNELLNRHGIPTIVLTNTDELDDFSSADITALLSKILVNGTFETYLEPFSAYTQEEFLDAYPNVWKEAGHATNQDLSVDVTKIEVIDDKNCEQEILMTVLLNSKEFEYRYETGGYIDSSVFDDITEYADTHLEKGFYFDLLSNDHFTTGIYLPKKLIPIFLALANKN